MAAVLAHEYNNLLTPIGSYAQLALENPADAQLTQKALTAAAEAIHKARSIANATLAFARPEEIQDDGTPHVTLQEAFTKANAHLNQRFEQDRVAMRFETEDLRPAISAVRLQQVLINLLDNARKALTEKPGLRQVTVIGQYRSGGVEVTVRDNGPGIEPGMLDEVFTAFVTKQPKMNRNDGAEPLGTGLGLRVCKDIIESAGGWIRVQSETGQGATFTFWLPAHHS